MVLQNRRGLDLLFLKQGGLCVALGETCCFYTNHSGVIKNSITLVRKNLKDREELRKLSGDWYQNLFPWSAWLTTLITTISGPLILLILGLTLGPCILNALLKFIHQCISSVKLMVLRTKYDPIQSEESKI
jgi:hypothetical protein